MFRQTDLMPEQIELLKRMVEAARNVPTDRRQKFMLSRALGRGDRLHHPSFPGRSLDIYHGDLEVLATSGLLTVTYGSRGTQNYDVHPRGFKYYEQLMEMSGEPLEEVQQGLAEYLDAEEFSRRHGKAYEKWASAAARLWSSDSEAEWTPIGHLCREAVQEFAADLVAEFQPTGVPRVKAKTVARMRAVLEQRQSNLGTTEKPFLDALLVYWGTVSDLIQRQEHGGQREAEPLVWEDARRVVFQTAVVMFEIDRSLMRSG